MNKELSKKIFRIIGEYLLISIGTVLYCMAWEWFVVPNGYSSGGVTGLCILLQYATEGAIPVSVSFLVINAVLLLLAFLILGRGFGIKTIYCIALSTLLFDLMTKCPTMFCTEGGLLYLGDSVLIPLLAGVVEGFGLGLVLRFGGSTGGSDILAMIINKYWPMSPGRFYMISDTVIIAAVLLLPDRGFQDVVYGYLMMFMSAYFVDYVVVGAKASTQLFVFSEHNREIADFIMHSMDRGVTAFKARGCFSGQDKEVLVIIVRNSEVHKVTEAVKDIDERAFLSAVPASSVYGEGFEEIKVGIKRRGRTAAKEKDSQ